VLREVLINKELKTMAKLAERKFGEAAIVLLPNARNNVFLICDHASNQIPPEYIDLGLGSSEREAHVAWDVGTADVTRLLSAQLSAPAVLGAISRLMVDLNRQPEAQDIIPALTHGVRVPGNEKLNAKERESRLNRFYRPYHDVIDKYLARSGATVLVSIHSFSHDLDPVSRDFDIGILFDEFEPLAHALAEKIGGAGMSVRLNEPYSGRAHVVSSAQTHGRRYHLPNYEIEINQRLLVSHIKSVTVGRKLAPTIEWLGEAARKHKQL
jgi:predicted N-formylglutamate amidohydrolase